MTNEQLIELVSRTEENSVFNYEIPAEIRAAIELESLKIALHVDAKEISLTK